MKIKTTFMVMRNVNDVWSIEKCDGQPLVKDLNSVEIEAEKDICELKFYIQWKSGFLSSDVKLGLFKVEGFSEKDVEALIIVAGKGKSEKDIDHDFVEKKQQEIDKSCVDAGYYFNACSKQDLSYNRENLKEDSIILFDNGKIGIISYPINNNFSYMLINDFFKDEEKGVYHKLENENVLLIGHIE